MIQIDDSIMEEAGKHFKLSKPDMQVFYSFRVGKGKERKGLITREEYEDWRDTD